MQTNVIEVTQELLKTWEVQYELGWYFVDETDRIDGNGPYKTRKEAAIALMLYFSNL